MQNIALHRTMVKAKLNFAPCEGIQNQGKSLLMGPGILGFEIRNTVQEIRN